MTLILMILAFVNTLNTSYKMIWYQYLGEKGYLHPKLFMNACHIKVERLNQDKKKSDKGRVCSTNTNKY